MGTGVTGSVKQSLASAAAAEVVAVKSRRAPGDSNMIRRAKAQVIASENKPGFFPVPSSSATLVLKAAATAFTYNVAGVDYTISDDTHTAVCSAGFNRISINAAGTLAIESKWPVANNTAPAAPSAGDLWFSLLESQMYKYSGSAWVAYDVIMVGAVYVTGGVITDCYNRPFNVSPYHVRKECGTGADGELVITSGTTTNAGTIKNYSAIFCSGTAVLTHTAAVTSLAVFLSQGPRIFVDTAGINLTGKGVATRAGQTGAGTVGSSGTSGCVGGQGGAGGGGVALTGGNGSSSLQANIPTTITASGSTGGTAGASATGTALASQLAAWARQSNFFVGFGGQGSTGAGNTASLGGSGGASGGAAHFVSEGVYVGATATETADGSAGGAGAAGGCGGGGGGGGGNVKDEAFTFQEQVGSVITSNGGALGAKGDGTAGDGKAGGNGLWWRERIQAA